MNYSKEIYLKYFLQVPSPRPTMLKNAFFAFIGTIDENTVRKFEFKSFEQWRI